MIKILNHYLLVNIKLVNFKKSETQGKRILIEEKKILSKLLLILSLIFCSNKYLLNIFTLFKKK